MSGPAARGIEAFFQDRYRKEAIYLPSGRLALYLIFREWLRPGDRLLLSPVNDDVVFFTVLAAGLIPVIGPLDPRTGNLDPEAVDEATWSKVRAVMTTNLYGIPDRMDRLEGPCRRHGLLLIEDGCQALDSRFAGRRIGEFSTLAAFSLTKHVAGVGGIVAFSDSGRRASLIARAASEIRRRSFPAALARGARRHLRDVADAAGTLGAIRRWRRRLLPPDHERAGHRMEYRPREVEVAQSGGGGLERFDPWVRVDNGEYRTAPAEGEAAATLRCLERFEANRRRRFEGAQALLALGLTPANLLPAQDTALFRVPLFVRDREAVRHRFAAAGLDIDYIYDPPLDEYAEQRLESLPSPPDALRWSRDVLPVDPLRAAEFLTRSRRLPPLIPAPAASIP